MRFFGKPESPVASPPLLCDSHTFDDREAAWISLGNESHDGPAPQLAEVPELAPIRFSRMSFSDLYMGWKGDRQRVVVEPDTADDDFAEFQANLQRDSTPRSLSHSLSRSLSRSDSFPSDLGDDLCHGKCQLTESELVFAETSIFEGPAKPRIRPSLTPSPSLPIIRQNWWDLPEQEYDAYKRQALKNIKNRHRDGGQDAADPATNAGPDVATGPPKPGPTPSKRRPKKLTIPPLLPQLTLISPLTPTLAAGPPPPPPKHPPPTVADYTRMQSSQNQNQNGPSAQSEHFAGDDALSLCSLVASPSMSSLQKVSSSVSSASSSQSDRGGKDKKDRDRGKSRLAFRPLQAFRDAWGGGSISGGESDASVRSERPRSASSASRSSSRAGVPRPSPRPATRASVSHTRTAVPTSEFNRVTDNNTRTTAMTATAAPTATTTATTTTASAETTAATTKIADSDSAIGADLAVPVAPVAPLPPVALPPVASSPGPKPSPEAEANPGPEPPIQPAAPNQTLCDRSADATAAHRHARLSRLGDNNTASRDDTSDSSQGPETRPSLHPRLFAPAAFHIHSDVSDTDSDFSDDIYELSDDQCELSADDSDTDAPRDSGDMNSHPRRVSSLSSTTSMRSTDSKDKPSKDKPSKDTRELSQLSSITKGLVKNSPFFDLEENRKNTPPRRASPVFTKSRDKDKADAAPASTDVPSEAAPAPADTSNSDGATGAIETAASTNADAIPSTAADSADNANVSDNASAADNEDDAARDQDMIHAPPETDPLEPPRFGGGRTLADSSTDSIDSFKSTKEIPREFAPETPPAHVNPAVAHREPKDDTDQEDFSFVDHSATSATENAASSAAAKRPTHKPWEDKMRRSILAEFENDLNDLLLLSGNKTELPDIKPPKDLEFDLPAREAAREAAATVTQSSSPSPGPSMPTPHPPRRDSRQGSTHSVTEELKQTRLDFDKVPEQIEPEYVPFSAPVPVQSSQPEQTDSTHSTDITQSSDFSQPSDVPHPEHDTPVEQTETEFEYASTPAAASVADLGVSPTTPVTMDAPPPHPADPMPTTPGESLEEAPDLIMSRKKTPSMASNATNASSKRGLRSVSSSASLKLRTSIFPFKGPNSAGVQPNYSPSTIGPPTPEGGNFSYTGSTRAGSVYSGSTAFTAGNNSNHSSHSSSLIRDTSAVSIAKARMKASLKSFPILYYAVTLSGPVNVKYNIEGATPAGQYGILSLPTAPHPWEKPPEDLALRGVWFLRLVVDSGTNTAGGFLTDKLFVPRDVWSLSTSMSSKVLDKRLYVTDEYCRAICEFMAFAEANGYSPRTAEGGASKIKSPAQSIDDALERLDTRIDNLSRHQYVLRADSELIVDLGANSPDGDDTLTPLASTATEPVLHPVMSHPTPPQSMQSSNRRSSDIGLLANHIFSSKEKKEDKQPKEDNSSSKLFKRFQRKISLANNHSSENLSAIPSDKAGSASLSNGKASEAAAATTFNSNQDYGARYFNAISALYSDMESLAHYRFLLQNEARDSQASRGYSQSGIIDAIDSCFAFSTTICRIILQDILSMLEVYLEGGKSVLAE